MSSKKNLLLQLLNICLSGILTLVVYDFFAPTLKEKNKSFIKYIIPSDDKNAMFSGQKITDAIIKHFLLQTFTLTGNEKKDEKVLSEFNSAVIRNSNRKKPINIIRLNLGNNVTYGRFISILNLMKKEDYKRYFEWENYFYVITRNIRIPGYDMSPPRLYISIIPTYLYIVN
jgi:biopolymer transport protein ExbD